MKHGLKAFNRHQRALFNLSYSDEYYTQLNTINYIFENVNLDFFKNKTIYLNCDDYRISNFYKFFKNNFKRLQLKKVICTSFEPEAKKQFKQLKLFELNKLKTYKNAYKAVFDGFQEDVSVLRYNGDFLSRECINILKSSDLVVTNPPFSLIVKYFKLMDLFHKPFLIIGPTTFMYRFYITKKIYKKELFYFAIPRKLNCFEHKKRLVEIPACFFSNRNIFLSHSKENLFSIPKKKPCEFIIVNNVMYPFYSIHELIVKYQKKQLKKGECFVVPRGFLKFPIFPLMELIDNVEYRQRRTNRLDIFFYDNINKIKFRPPKAIKTLLMRF